METITSMIGQGIREGDIRVTGERRSRIYEEDRYQDVDASPEHLEGDFEGLAVRENGGFITREELGLEVGRNVRENDVVMT